MSHMIRLFLQGGALAAATLCAGCKPAAGPPPPSLLFGGLPISGNLDDAKRAGFTSCIYLDAIRLRCRRHGVTLLGQGPYEAAVDFGRSDGSDGFAQLTIWHPYDQYAVYKIRDELIRQGWHFCRTGTDERGDQVIFTHPGTSTRISMDLSYWGKRRFRIIPGWNKREKVCVPDNGTGVTVLQH